MASPLRTVSVEWSAAEAKEAMRGATHNGYPVVTGQVPPPDLPRPRATSRDLARPPATPPEPP